MITLTLEPEEFEYLCDAIYNDRDVLVADARADFERTDGMQIGEAHHRRLADLNERMIAHLETAMRQADCFLPPDVAPGGINVVNKTKFVLEFPRFVWTDDEDEIDDIMLALEHLGIPKDSLAWFKPDDETTDAIMSGENIPHRQIEFVFCIYEATDLGYTAMRAMLEPYERATVSMTRKECSEAQDAIGRILHALDSRDRYVLDADVDYDWLGNLLQRLSDCD